MKKPIVVAATLAAVVAASIDPLMVLSSSGDPPSKPVVEPAGEDEPGASRFILTKMIASEPTNIHFVQFTADAVSREVAITLTPTDSFGAAAGDQDLTLQGGRRVIVRNFSITAVPDGLGYTTSFNFFLPRASLPPEMMELAETPRKSVLATALSMISEALFATAQATSHDGVIGTYSQVIRGDQAVQPFREALRIRTFTKGPLKGGYCMVAEIRATEDFVKRALAANANPNTSAGTHADLRREAYEAEVRTEREIAASREEGPRRSPPPTSGGGSARSQVRMVRSADVVVANFQVQIILAEKRAFKERLAALRKCHQNPTNPLAQKAKDTDPAHKIVEDAMDAVELEVDLVSAMRETASYVNTAAGSALGLVGGPVAMGIVGESVTGMLGEAEDRMLKKSLEETLATLEKCVVPCPPCGPSPATVRLANSGRNASPTSAAPPNFTPGPAKPAPPTPPANVCKPLSRADVRYFNLWQESGCNELGCGTAWRKTTFAGSAALSYVGDDEQDPPDDGYEGVDTADFLETAQTVETRKVCTRLVDAITQGPVSITVRAQYSIDNTVTGGTDTGGMDADTAVVEVFIRGELPQNTTAKGCKEDYEATDSSFPGQECHFYGVDLMQGGHYVIDTPEAPGSVGKCELLIH